MSPQDTAGISDHWVPGNTQANNCTLLCYQMHVEMWSVLDSVKVGLRSSTSPVHTGYTSGVLLQQHPANIPASKAPAHLIASCKPKRKYFICSSQLLTLTSCLTTHLATLALLLRLIGIISIFTTLYAYLRVIRASPVALTITRTFFGFASGPT